jgi:hypothetical protein
MITLAAIALPLAVLAAAEALVLRYGAEDRPGFNERAPLS